MFGYFLVILVATVCQLQCAPVNNEEFNNAVGFLRKYGYITEDYPSVHEVREALTLYQEGSLLNPTGELDVATLTAMKQKRCPHKDIGDGEEQEEISRNIRKKRFALMKYTRVPSDKFDKGRVHLTWRISKYSKKLDKTAVREVVQKAFDIWSSQANIERLPHVKFIFEEVASNKPADIDIRWESGEHDDGERFDGASYINNVIAHALIPKPNDHNRHLRPFVGVVHLDEDDKFSLELDGRGSYLPYVITHEIGHVLGLNHTYNQESVMHASYKDIEVDKIQLSRDDKCGINWVYYGPSNECLYIFLVSEVMRTGADYESRRELHQKTFHKQSKLDMRSRPRRESSRKTKYSSRSHHHRY